MIWTLKKGGYIAICNPQQLKIRTDKLVANILHISRSKGQIIREGWNYRDNV